MSTSISNSINNSGQHAQVKDQLMPKGMGMPIHARHAGDPPETLGVLVIGADFQALGVIRALTEAGVPTFLLANERGIAWYSRFARRKARNLDLLNDDRAGVEFLVELADSQSMRGWVLACVDDDSVEFLARNHEQLSQVFQVPVPGWESSEHFFKKNLSYQKALEAGIPVPAQYDASSLERLKKQKIIYPVVLKPSFKKDYYDKTKVKGILIESEEQLEKEYEEMLSLIPPSQIVVQEFLAGGTKNLFSYAALFDGEHMLQGMAVRRIRQHPMDFGHATTYAMAADIPELEQHAAKFLKAVGYRGVAEVEFMLDERTGEYKFLEMNGRFWGWHSLTHRAGLNLPRDLFRMLLGYEVYRDEVDHSARWMRLLTDLPTLARETWRRKMSPLTWLKDFFSRPGMAVWSWRDPLPFFVEVLIAPYLWWKKGF